MTPLTMLEAFTRSAERRPDWPAIEYLGTTLTFAELDAQSDALATALQARGVRHGDRVAGYMQNVPQFYIVLLATWKAGGIFVTVSPMLRHKELRHILEDSGATVLVAFESLWEAIAKDVVGGTRVRNVITTADSDFAGPDLPTVIPTQNTRPLATDNLVSLVHTFSERPPGAVPLDGSDIAVLTYTSGTTGPAKGAMNTHANLVAASETYRLQAKLHDRDVILGMAPLFHVTGLTAHIGAGFVAAIPTILTYRFNTELVLGAIERQRPTFTVAAITAYVALMNARQADLSSLSKTFSGGAPIAPALAEEWRRVAGVPLVPVYGLTETSGPTHMVPLGEVPPVDPDSGALSVGRPVPGTTAVVVAEDGAELPPGSAGELVVRGPQVVPGYWEKPDETSHAFVDGALRTGDIAVVDRSGWCYIVDRKKDLIIASGFKVWPREVEDCLLAHPDVREAAVVGVPDGYRGESVRAFVSLRDGATVTAGQLVQYGREHMAAYKYPREVVVLADLPTSASGKILRRVLRDEFASKTT